MIKMKKIYFIVLSSASLLCLASDNNSDNNNDIQPQAETYNKILHSALETARQVGDKAKDMYSKMPALPDLATLQDTATKVDRAVTKVALNIYDNRYVAGTGVSLIAFGALRKGILGTGPIIPLVLGIGACTYVCSHAFNTPTDETIDQKKKNFDIFIDHGAHNLKEFFHKRLDAVKEKENSPQSLQKIVENLPTIVTAAPTDHSTGTAITTQTESDTTDVTP